MKFPSIKNLTPDEKKDLIDKIEDFKYKILNTFPAHSQESYWINHISDEVSWEEYIKDA